MNVLEVYEAAGIDSLPTDPAAAARVLGIKVVSFKSVAEVYGKTERELYNYSRLGFSFRDERGLVIAINGNSCGERRRRFTLAHELGHCVLGHLEGDFTDGIRERKADGFAAEFLAPLAVLDCCRVSGAREIALMCGISQSAAEIAFDKLSKKRREGFDFLENSVDSAIVKRFERFITRYVSSETSDMESFKSKALLRQMADCRKTGGSR